MDTLMVFEEVCTGLADDGGVKETSERRWGCLSAFICFSSSFTVKRTSLIVRLATLLASRADSPLEKLI